ncbi:MAG: TonB-dependent receptor [Bacteroidota bacterium]
MKKLLFLSLLFPVTLLAQNRFDISGSVSAASGEPLPFANILLDKGNKYAVADKDGNFTIPRVVAGAYIMQVSSLGYTTKSLPIEVNQALTLSIVLESQVESLGDVTVYGKSEATKISEKAITISSLDIQKVADQALGVETVLKTSSGVVVRQSGGLGSNLNINLNGLTGQAVRVYYDGIPIQVYGSGIQLNSIPVDALERVDVYKGVMPIDVGTDALGGGINLVPLQQNVENLRTSYSFGSFNTHRFTLNGLKKFSENTSLSVNSFFNYADNDYRMRDIPNVVEVRGSDGNVIGVEEETIDADRFHDRHTSGYVEAALRLQNRSWADRLEIASSYAYRFDEIQQGRFIANTSVGEADQEFNTFTQRVDYRKAFFNDKLNLRYYGVLSLALSKTQDSTTAIYNWRGQILETPNSSGSEIFARPTLRDGDELGTAHRILVNYKLNSTFTLSVSDFYRYSRVKGDDPVGARLTIDGESIDPNTIPSRLNRNIFGAELRANLWDDKLTPQVFYKNYSYNAESIDILQQAATVLPIREVQDNDNGYGVALKYQVHPNFFVRSSFERAVRIPTETEVFGDFAAILPNFELRPEKSNNLNLGIAFEKQLDNQRFISLKVDGFLRDQEDLIRLDQFGPENAIFINEAEVDGRGVEASFRVIPVRNLNISANYTYQSNEIASVGDSETGATTGAQVPNIPQLFYNVGATYSFERIFNSPNTLEFNWTYFYTDRFSINEVADLDNANPIFIIPEQNLHNAGITYRMPSKGISLALNVQNVFDAEIFDNFRIPRPGINYAFKINYSL